jgi:hypothetical protein
LPERSEHAATFSLAFAAVALQALDIGKQPIETRAHLLDLVVQGAALRRLSAEQREKAGPLAAVALGLLAQPVKLGLLFSGSFLVSPDLFGLRRVNRTTTLDHRELPLKTQADGVAGCAAL